MLYAQTFTLSKVTAILAGASISSTMFLTKIGKTGGSSTAIASFEATLDKHGYFFDLTMQIRAKKRHWSGSGGESRCGDGGDDDSDGNVMSVRRRLRTATAM
jgi:hypothetical protein